MQCLKNRVKWTIPFFQHPFFPQWNIHIHNKWSKVCGQLIITPILKCWTSHSNTTVINIELIPPQQAITTSRCLRMLSKSFWGDSVGICTHPGKRAFDWRGRKFTNWLVAKVASLYDLFSSTRELLLSALICRVCRAVCLSLYSCKQWVWVKNWLSAFLCILFAYQYGFKLAHLSATHKYLQS